MPTHRGRCSLRNKMETKSNIRWSLLAILLAAGAAGGFAQQISNGIVTVRAVKEEDAFTGFDVLSGEQTAAVVRLSSDHLLTARNCRVSPRTKTLAFTGLTGAAGTGLQMDAADSIRVRLNPGDPYPVVSFDLTLRAFDVAAWKAKAGPQPFHFLALYLADAEVWHQRGWLNATPLADPFPLLLDRHAGTPEISAYHYDRTWSYTPPLGANPLPIIGLWAPGARHYAGLEFQTTRLEDNSERDLATGYHWLGQASPPYSANPAHSTNEARSQFVALVYPFGGHGYQQLVFPKPGTHLLSHGVLLWSTNLSSTDDPNRFFFGYLWQRAKDRLPRVPANVDLSWLPGGIRLRDFEGPPGGGLIGGVEGPFQVPGSKVLSGWRWQNEMPTQVAATRNDPARLQALEAEATELVRDARHFRVDGEDCVFWEKPLAGSWTPAWGGEPVKTLHNANGFAVGRLLLGLYRDLGRPEYLPIVDGVFHWAKHVVWTRNEFADVPSSPFAIGGTLPTSFCLDYYFTFKDAPDPARREAARRALDLARSFTYRYLIFWPSDNNRFDHLDAAFLWEPNSGRDWTGAACANEVFWNLDTLAQTAVHTGDPVLRWALEGSLDRWHQLYQEKYANSIADYAGGDMTEGYGLYAGNMYGVGVRAPYGFASPLAMIEPVGDSTVRVLAGEQAAMVFGKRGAQTRISGYRYTGAGDLSFVLEGASNPFDLSLTVPYVDLSKKSVVRHPGGQALTLEPGRDFRRPLQAPWSLYLRSLNNGDRVVVGQPNEASPVLPSATPLALESGRTPAPQPNSVFEPVPLVYDDPPDVDWDHLDSWAGLPRGTFWAYGVQFTLAPSSSRSTIRRPVRFDKPLRTARTVALLYSAGGGPRPALIYADGTRASVDPASEALAWHAWPPIYAAKLLVAIVPTDGKPIAGVDPGGRLVWALSATRSGFDKRSREFVEIVPALREGAANWQRQQRDERTVAELKTAAATLPDQVIAILPPNPAGAAVNLAARAGLTKHAVNLTPGQVIDDTVFNAKRFPVALYAGGEDYVDTVRAPGDAAAAVVRYVQEGGTLVLLSPMPWPMYYATGPGFHRPDPLTRRFGLPLSNTFETPPKENLTVVLEPGPTTLRDLPGQFPFPSDDPRLRAIDPAQIPAGVKYTPIYRVVDDRGGRYGDAAGRIELANGGCVLYLWGGLLRDPDHGLEITRAALDFLISAARAR